MAKNTVKRGRPATHRSNVLLKLKDAKRATVQDLGITAPYAKVLVEGGFITPAETVKSGKRGRPANVYKLTPRGQATALNLSKAAAKAAATQVEDQATEAPAESNDVAVMAF